jgi:mono/diheme cytochrome c family protein
MFRRAVFTLIAAICSTAMAQPPVSYNRDIRPILAKHCWACHGPDEKARQADLRLDSFAAATEVRDDRAAIRAKDPERSELMLRVLSQDEDTVMPPREGGTPLTQAQIELLRRWIASGAEYEVHWAFVPPKRPQLPQVENAGWVHHPIDQLVLAKLEAAKLAPSPTADKATLLRRVYLDLIGIPPSPTEVTQVLESQDPQWFERLVDSLLTRTEFGEKWGRAWLDLARYSDTNGYEKDRTRSIWPYRDWVIQAINADMPFDQFTVQQIAGDMLAPDDLQAKIATGFHRNTMLNEEGGIDPLEFRFYAMNDRVATTGLVWLGLTTGCAQCHTHKFDPITHTEYYQFMALLNNADEPDQEVLSPTLADERKRIATEVESKAKLLPSQFPIEGSAANDLTPEERASKSQLAFQSRFASWAEQQRSTSVDWKITVPSEMKTNLPRLEALEDGSIYSTGDITKRDFFELTINKEALGDQPLTALRLEALPDPRLPAGGPGRCYYEGRRGDFFLSEVTLRDGDRTIKIREGSNSYGKNGLGSGSAEAKNVFDGDGSTGWSTAQREGEAHQLVLVLEEPLQVTEHLKIEMLFERHYATSLGRFRWSVSASGKKAIAQDLAASLQTALVKEPAQWTAAERAQLEQHFAMTCDELKQARKEIDQLRKSIPSPPTTLIMQERTADNPRPTHRHHRGEYLSPKELVSGGLPEVFRVLTANPPTNRLELARWLTSKDNPLVGRVVVNRVWQSLFGDGLVRSQGDFGMQSSPPTHPELLDWLAVDWMESGWSMKKLLRDIVLSATYQQSSSPSPELRAYDPENLLLARFSRQRVDAEVLRDTMLTASGLLCERSGGPSVRPPQPASVTALAYGNESWSESKGGDRFRRSLYTFSKRTAPFAAYQAFDAPSGETCAVRRERSNTPLQALTLLNDNMFIEMAEELGSSVYQAADDDQQRARALAVRAWSRPPNDEEVSSITRYVNSQRERIAAGVLTPEIQSNEGSRVKQLLADSNAESKPQLLAWIMVARAIMNTDEAVTKP